MNMRLFSFQLLLFDRVCHGQVERLAPPSTFKAHHNLPPSGSIVTHFPQQPHTLRSSSSIPSTAAKGGRKVGTSETVSAQRSRACCTSTAWTEGQRNHRVKGASFLVAGT